MGPSPNSVIRFIKLKKFFNMFVGRKSLDSTSEALLEKIMLNWHEELNISVGDLISSSSDLASPSSLHKHIKLLFDAGFITYLDDQDDRRIKIPIPSENTIQYYEDLAFYAEKCFGDKSFDLNDPNSILYSSDLLNQSYLRAQSQALLAYSLAEQQIHNAKSFQELTRGVCEAIASQNIYICACIGFSKIDSFRSIEMVAVEGEAKAYGEALTLSWDPNNIYGSGPTGIAIRSGKSVVLSDTEVANNFGPWVEHTRQAGIRSSISVPIFVQDKPSGIIIIYSSEPYSFGPTEIYLFEKLSNRISSAIATSDRNN